jgi:CelD/BcsL family acetyltransferase involved in cellulose biosynthesis
MGDVPIRPAAGEDALKTLAVNADSAVSPIRETTPEAVRLESFTSIDELGEEWTELAERSGNVFSTPEWMSTWWRHFGHGHELLLTTCRAGSGSLVAILPMYRRTAGGIRMVRFLGHGPGDQLGPVCGPEHRSLAARGLRSLLEDQRLQWDLFLAEQLPGDESWQALLGARRVSHTGMPVLRPAGRSWGEFLATRSSNFRQQVGRRERNLRRRHDVRYRLAGAADRLDADLDILFDLHRRRWEGRPSHFSEQEEFHREFAALAQQRGWLRLWFLELDGEPVAAWYGFRSGGVEYFYQAGRDPHSQGSPGFVLFCHTIRQALEDGVHEYRLLRGDEAYKYRFANADRGLVTLGIGRGAIGTAALAAGIATTRLGPVKALLKGPLDL